MRLWMLHPKYLDSKGLVALWREALLAQAVLKGQTVGYLNHPQLIRFRETPSPTRAIASYLQGVLTESRRRGYHFDAEKIGSEIRADLIEASEGQLDYEWEHLKRKLLVRSPSWLAGIQAVARPDPHPLFRVVPGCVAGWEVRVSASASEKK